MYNLSRDPTIGRLAAEALAHLRTSKQGASVAPPAPKPSAWHKVPAVLDLARKIVLNVVVIVVGGVLIAVTVKAAIQPQFVFEPIKLPTELANSGYGANVLADRVLDHIHDINRQTSKDMTSLITPRSESVSERMFIGTSPQYAALSAIQVPSSSLNLQSVVLLLRDLFKPDDIRVTGDLTILTDNPAKADNRVAAAVSADGKGKQILPMGAPSTYVLQLRYVRGATRQARTVHAHDFDQLIAKAAEAILDLSEPHILAFYQYGRKSWSNVDEILDRVLGDGRAMADLKWALTLRGQRLLELSRHDEAIRLFEQVAKLDSNTGGYDLIDSSRNRQQAIAYTNWGNALQKAGYYDGAVEQYKRALQIDPAYALALYNWGNALETMRDYRGAIEKYKRAAAIHPSYAPIFNSWGTVLRRMGDYDGATAKYKHALELNPKFTLAYNNWGIALRIKGDFDAAIDKYKRAIAIDPNDAVAYNSWGVTLRVKGDYDGAIDKYKRALEIDPNYAVAYNSWGVALAAKNDDPGSIEMYKRAIAIDPRYALPFYNWGLALDRLKDYDAAIEKYQRCLEISPKYASALNNWGVILEERSDYEGAIAKYRAATEADPKYVRAFRNWAGALEALGKVDEAAAMRERTQRIEAQQSSAARPQNADTGMTAKK